jgi:hypothetical protein
MHAARPEDADLITPHQRWIAARRLAAGESVLAAAGAAGVRTADLRAAIAADPEFDDLVAEFRAIKALPPEAKRVRLADLCWDGAERAILDGRVTTLNLCVRTLNALDDPEHDGDEADEGDDAGWDSIDEMVEGAMAFRRTLSPAERAEYDALCVRAGVRAEELRLQREAQGREEAPETPSPPPSPSARATGREPRTTTFAPSPATAGEGRGEGVPPSPVEDGRATVCPVKGRRPWRARPARRAPWR